MPQTREFRSGKGHCGCRPGTWGCLGKQVSAEAAVAKGDGRPGLPPGAAWLAGWRCLQSGRAGWGTPVELACAPCIPLAGVWVGCCSLGDPPTGRQAD